MVLVVADDTMGEEDLEVTRIVGLSHSAADATAAGFLVFQKTRGGTKQFFRWWLSKVAAPYGTAIREALVSKSHFLRFETSRCLLCLTLMITCVMSCAGAW